MNDYKEIKAYLRLLMVVFAIPVLFVLYLIYALGFAEFVRSPWMFKVLIGSALSLLFILGVYFA